MRIKNISKNEHQIYSITYRFPAFLPINKTRKAFSTHESSRNWYWLDTGKHVGVKLSRVLSGVRSRNLDSLEN